MQTGTSFEVLNEDWNAEPNSPEPVVRIDGSDVVLEFGLSPWQFPRFSDGQRGHIRFRNTWRYRLGPVNDEGWYRAQCRFSAVAPAWGEFYEVFGHRRLPGPRGGFARAARDLARARVCPVAVEFGSVNCFK